MIEFYEIKKLEKLLNQLKAQYSDIISGWGDCDELEEVDTSIALVRSRIALKKQQLIAMVGRKTYKELRGE